MGFMTDVTARLGGKQGSDGGVALLHKMVRSSGGLQGLVWKLSRGGLGQQVDSWVGTGENQPVTGPQVRRAIDPRQLSAMADQAGMTPEETSEELASVLPVVVNKATPQGQLPDADPFAKGLEKVKRMLAM
ncbi:MAG TPA: YidB family protein [Streptosporangiaceae bacterium]|jgi:uncharacterized protein YidB (DUF937 family)|nr:YidB family protein [Streptosporangiaceae bacterium]